MIQAAAHDDNWIYTAIFDATEYFQNADALEIVALAQEQWGGDYEADKVAEYFDGENKDVSRMFEHKGETGFECYVNSEQALAWLKANRPEVYEIIERNGDQEPIPFVDLKDYGANPNDPDGLWPIEIKW